MNNLSLRNKIILILALPIFTIVFLSVNVLLEKIKEKNSINTTKNYLELSLKATNILNMLQNEREFNLIFIDSYGREYKNELVNIINDVNKQINNFNTFLNSVDLSKYDKKVLNNINLIKKDLKQLKQVREQVQQLSLSDKEVLSFYKSLDDKLLMFLDDVLTHSNDGVLSKKIQAFQTIVNITEGATLERRVLRATFEKGVLSNSDLHQFINSYSNQETYIKLFKTVVSKNQFKNFQDKITNCEECKKVKEYRQLIDNKAIKNEIINRVVQLAGFGGLIQNYKDYLIKSDDKYLNKIQRFHSSILRELNKYRRIKGTTKEEKKLIKKVKNIFDEYMGYSVDIMDAIAQNKTIKQIDNSININDTDAIRALKSLNNNIYGANAKDWFNVSSKRIELLKKYELELSDDIKSYIDGKTAELNNSFIFMLAIVLIIILLVFIVSGLITKKIINSLKLFKEGLEYSFAYVIREKDYLKPMEVKGKDEFALMTAHMNTQIEKVKSFIEQDKQVVTEITDVVEKASNGFLEYSIVQKGATAEVESLRVIINQMISETKTKINNINKVLDSYAVGKYSFRLSDDEKKGLYGDFGTLSAGSVLLGQSISQLIAMITNAGLELESNTDILTRSSKELSNSANEQAASLEETAASVDQITGNMKSSSNDVSKMLTIADELNQSAQIGNEEAKKTASSMDEINEKVTAISEAISIIDQIAFQTNILSLNAAVEAATAGEAGKGFAVVAQEVRNLANRSADAANSIKQLVEDASYKSNEGKTVATNMIKGFENLSSKIVDTKDIIDNVSMAIKEQESGMVQVNDAIALLDKMTQDNAVTSSSIDNLSKEVANLSTRLLGITQKAQINDKYYNMVDDVDLIQHISKYKNDHINFKKKHFKLLGDFEAVTVTDCKSCNLGKWIIECETQNKEYTHSNEWNLLKQRHELVHQKVQEFMNLNSTKASNSELKKVASEIEFITGKVFSSLNDIAVVNTKLLRN